MNRKFARLSLTMVLTLMLALVVGIGSAYADDPVPGTPVSGDGVVPLEYDGNISCEKLGYSFSYKIEGNGAAVYTGTFPLDSVNTVTTSSDGFLINWSSTIGIDAVIVKGGPDSNAYVYVPEDTADTGLGSPTLDNNNVPQISHVEFCFDYELTASKTANATYTRTYSWTITKSVDDNSHTGFTGDSFSSNYTVAVDQTVVDSNFAVSGNIVVNNPTPFTVGFSVSDSVGGTNATVNCPTNSLSPGASTTCTYNASFGNTNPGNGTNTATITSNNSNVLGTTASANYTFGAPTTTIGPATITVNDTNGSSWQFSGDGSKSYSKTFTCDADEGTHNNTATIVETGQSASASVSVDCYALTVTKDATTSFNRKWNWTIDKTGDQTLLTLTPGQQFLVNYTVVVTAASTDSAHAVSGNISVNNPAPISATLTGVSDIVSPSIAATVNCGVTFPYTLAAGGTLNCTYSASLPDGSARTNTATATIQNTPSGTTSFTHTVPVTFGAPTSEEDECINVVDDLYGSLGTVCAGDSPKTFTYSRYVGPYAECGTYTVVNTATFTTNDTSTSGSNDHTVTINVPCLGCTLTQGYWKTHSDRGPAPYDDAWKNVGPLEEDTLFFNSGKTWYTVFWTPPAGNAYFNLAHQYMAAKLNVLNGASAPQSVTDALAAAEALFNGQGINDTSLTKAESKTALALASTLDKYNNGLIGPGHCSE